jgi:hypothetical protein
MLNVSNVLKIVNFVKIQKYAKDVKMDSILMNKLIASHAISNVRHASRKIFALFVILGIFYIQMEHVKIFALNKESL